MRFQRIEAFPTKRPQSGEGTTHEVRSIATKVGRARDHGLTTGWPRLDATEGPRRKRLIFIRVVWRRERGRMRMRRRMKTI